MRVFVASAAGAIGQRLVPQLVAAGHVVLATTRSQAKIAGLRVLGADAVVLDGLDAVAVGEAVGRAEADVIVHQMTSLAGMGFNLPGKASGTEIGTEIGTENGRQRGDGPPRGDHDPRPFRVVPQHKGPQFVIIRGRTSQQPVSEEQRR